MIDLARALSREPQLLLLDEITAALPSDLAERVFAVMTAVRERGGSVLFITHRLKEVIASCDRATILRDGGAVATIDPEGARGGGDRRLHARARGGASAAARRARRRTPTPAARRRAPATPRRSRSPGSPPGASRDVSFTLQPGEILGIAALEGQGQDELFEVLSGQRRAEAGEVKAAGPAAKARHPYDAISAGVVLVPADRLQALLPQRSVRENIASPRYNRHAPLGRDQHARRG